MTTPVLGPQPIGFRVNLPADADFTGEVVSDGDPFDPDAWIELRFDLNPVVAWRAEIDPDDLHIARWYVDEIEVAAVIAARPTKVRLHYELGEADLLWDTGRVRVV
ncbi:MAG TPA: hypothetical protein VK735_18440 [Pseudonocardia sp.]|uniref:hypothetical protein n=1 Tax=Pseudonocardia sp. TaxID=60912 RepID=UPI002BD472A9|nr:hypothetical protein [Pseudonocardia sp.]HTF49425.1 hypothetical protein [Pseudonocardia sp.]